MYTPINTRTTPLPLLLAAATDFPAGDCRKWAAEENCVLHVQEFPAASTPAEDVAGVILGINGEQPVSALAARIAQTAAPVVLVAEQIHDTADASRLLAETGAATIIWGRGEKNWRWAIRHLRNRLAWPFQTVAYGPLPDQCGDLRLPAETGKPAPLCIILHGGFWREPFKKDLTDNIAVSLAQNGFITWNADYRTGGTTNCAATHADVLQAVAYAQQLAENFPVDRNNIFLLGHSAGAQLALWAARNMPAQVPLKAAVSLAGVLDMEMACQLAIGNEAVKTFLRSEEKAIQSYSPLRQLPATVPELVVHGAKDDAVPFSIAETYMEKAIATGSPTRFLPFPDAEHMDLVKTGSPAWNAIQEWLIEQAGILKKETKNTV